MSPQDNAIQPSLRVRELHWLVSLRWVAGALILAGDGFQWLLGPLLAQTGPVAVVGLGVLLFNASVFATLRSSAGETNAARIALVQIVVDLVALTTLVLLTGRLSSPLLPLYVFQMWFASLLMGRRRAYAAATLAVLLLAAGLALTGHWPRTAPEFAVAAVWALSLPVAVYLGNHVTLALFQRERERLAQGERIAAMREELATHERATLQQERLAAVGQLAAGVAHEVSNPLASMDGLLQLMQRHPDKPRPEAVAQLREQIARIAETVHRLRTLSHPDLGEPAPVDLDTLVDETLGVLAYDHRVRRVEVVRERDAGGPVTLVRRAVEQALINLVLNALDAMDGVEKPRLIVRTRREEGWRLIEVADNGHGIAPADHERVMKPFETTKPAGRGTGLGLPISRGLIRDQGGDLTFQSEAGRGAVFRIRLPEIRPPGADDCIPEARNAEPDPARAQADPNDLQEAR